MDTHNKPIVQRIQTIFITSLTLIGAIAIALSVGAELFGFDITPGFGIVQMVQLLIGLTFLTIAGYTQIYLWRNVDEPRSLQADIGLRLGATGLIVAYIAGLSDLVGVGTHVGPTFARPVVGPLQLIGMGISILVIAGGLLLYFTSRGTQQSSSLEFLID